MLVGGIRSPETAAELLRSGAADFISLCRPLMQDPELARHWRETLLSRSADRG